MRAAHHTIYCPFGQQPTRDAAPACPTATARGIRPAPLSGLSSLVSCSLSDAGALQLLRPAQLLRLLAGLATAEDLRCATPRVDAGPDVDPLRLRHRRLRDADL